MNAHWIRNFILAGGMFGALLFGAALIASLVNPLLVEQTGREIIRIQLQKKIGERIDALDDKFIAAQAARFSSSYAGRIEDYKRMLRERAPERVAAAIAEMRQLDCECRKKIEENVRRVLERGIAGAQGAMHGLDTLIRQQYQHTAAKITREVRIFTGVNALVCLALVGAALLRPRAGAHLLPIALVLFAAGLITAYLYLFGQDWLTTIVFGSYVGWAYVAYLAVVFAFLSDVVFNRGRVSVRLLRTFTDGAGGSFAPC